MGSSSAGKNPAGTGSGSSTRRRDTRCVLRLHLLSCCLRLGCVCVCVCVGGGGLEVTLSGVNKQEVRRLAQQSRRCARCVKHIRTPATGARCSVMCPLSSWRFIHLGFFYFCNVVLVNDGCVLFYTSQPYVKTLFKDYISFFVYLCL